MDRIAGFLPIVSEHARVLVLGSMPSVASLEHQQYYARPQNVFWRLMGDLFSAGPALAYHERVERLDEAGVAVWDVLASCVRPGSLDSAIEMKSAEPNEFDEFFDRHTDIRHVFFNGRKAEQIFQKRVLPGLSQTGRALLFYSMPSTSPAMAAMSYDEKLSRWSQLRRVLQVESRS